MIDSRYLGDYGDTTIPPAREKTADGDPTIEAWKTIAKNIKAQGSAALMQINHLGRQSPTGAGSRKFFDKTVALSPIPLNFGEGFSARCWSG